MIIVKKAGLLTSIQDLGRRGFQKYGVIVSGAMDRLAHRVANLLVGNEEDLPTIEITLLGPTIEFQQDCLIAICGGDLSATINGKPIGLWRPILVKANSELKFGACKTGCRVYLAVAGGFTVPTVMNSKSTYLRAGIGGYEGRPLQTGDQLSVGKTGELSNRIMNQLSQFFTEDIVEEKWQVKPMRFFEMKRGQVVRVIKGRHFHLFSKESQHTFFQNDYTISNQSDRMGYRLKGKELILSEKEEMISEAVNFGTIQVPADGNPIILLADRQTTGGYPKIGQVASVDLGILAQAKPGDRIRFTEISFEKAQFLYLKRERKIHELKLGIYLKYS